MAAHMCGAGGSTYIGELKLVDPLGSAEEKVSTRGGRVAFGNTAPFWTDKVCGRTQQGTSRAAVLSALSQG